MAPSFIGTTKLVIEGSATTQTMDTIEHNGAYWLVPAWLASPDPGFAMPERMIPLDRFRHTAMTGADHHFAVIGQVPKILISGLSSPATQAYGVVFRPDIQVARKH